MQGDTARTERQDALILVFLDQQVTAFDRDVRVICYGDTRRRDEQCETQAGLERFHGRILVSTVFGRKSRSACYKAQFSEFRDLDTSSRIRERHVNAAFQLRSGRAS